MLGFADVWIALVYLLCILSTLLCVGYGLKHWNDDDDSGQPVHPEGENLEFEETI